MLAETLAIPLPIRVLAIAASLAYLYMIVAALRGSRITVRQSVLWLISGAALLGVSLFPDPVMWLADRMGFVAPSNAGFIVWLVSLTGLAFYQSITTSRQTAQLKTLAQELALREAELRLGDRASRSGGTH